MRAGRTSPTRATADGIRVGSPRVEDLQVLVAQGLRRRGADPALGSCRGGFLTLSLWTRYRKTDNVIGKPIGDLMDWENPLRSITPTVDADVLQVLAGTHTSVTGNQLARLAGRSYAQVSSVVRRLTEEGIVSVEQHGRTYSYRLNRDHALAPSLLDIFSAPSRIEDEVGELVRAWNQPADTVALFGSAARREAVRGSDVDVLVVRLDEVDSDDGLWQTQLAGLVDLVEERSGNRVQFIEITQSELAEAIRSGQPLIGSLRGDARTLVGEDLRLRLAANKRC